METINYKTYVSFEIAKLLERAGFDWKQYNFYNHKGIRINSTIAANWNDKIWYIDGGKVSAPTLDIAQKWLREIKNIDINVITDFDSVKKLYYTRYIIKNGYYKIYYITNNQGLVYFNTYEEAQEAGIKKALEIILEKGK